MKKIICLYGGPGSGKSTTAAGLFYHLKMMGYNCELNREYVKDWVWEGRKYDDGDQTYFFAKQSRKERILIRNGLDFIITDSPLILTHFYGLKYDWLEQNFNTSEIMLKHHHAYCKKYGYTIEHFILERNKGYNPAGRNQNEEEAKQFDLEIRDLLDSKSIKYTIVRGETVHQILEKLGLNAEKK
jgi:nicotinamide riboside kinase